MRLYAYDHCPFCTRARVAIALKNETVELVFLMEDDVETPTRLTGKKMVPVLEKIDGSYMAESLDIVRYVDELGKPMFAGEITPEIDSWLKDVWPTTLKLVIPRFTQADFAELSTPEARESYRQREEKSFGDLSELISHTPVLMDEITPKLHALVSLVKARQHADINDVVLWPVLRCLSIVKALTFPPEVRDYAIKYEALTGIPLLFRQAM